jgi:enolase
MAKIANIWAREIIDSRGIPTVEAACQLDSGHVAVSSVPTGASTGTHEALELRDNDQQRFNGKGVLKAVANINSVISKALLGKDPSDQLGIDKIMIDLDGSENKSKLGANSILAVSEVVAKVGALANNQPLYYWIASLASKAGIPVSLKIPTPVFNIINGGLHGAGNLDFQEFHVIPSSTKVYSDGLRMAVEIYGIVKKNLVQKGAIHSVGDEGGFAPNLFTNLDALELLMESIKQSFYRLGRDVLLGLDVAANEIYKNGVYAIKDKTSPMDENNFIEYYKALNEEYHLALLEDPLYEESWDGWVKLNNLLGDQLILIGDDLLVTNPERLKKAIKLKACGGILIKPNQIGTVSETLNVIKMAKDAKMKVNVSHRSGETNDWFIADFAVGVAADYVKFGAPARGERVAKYNRLLSIEKELGSYK